MTAAILTTVFWAFCTVAASRAVRQLGSNEANFWRLSLAMVILGVIVFSQGYSFWGTATWVIFLSGVIGFGLGDFGIFQAFPRLGARLTILYAQCVAAPIAGLIEWVWMGVVLTAWQILLGTVILIGVGIALLPEKDSPRYQGPILVGSCFGLLAAFCQALGAILSRKGYLIAEAEGFLSPGAELATSEAVWLGVRTAFERVGGGLLFAAMVFALGYYLASWRHRGQHPDAAKDPLSNKSKWILLHVITGPVLGVACYQWALASAPSGVVLPIVATTPIVTIPFARWLEGERPSRRSLAGGALAVLAAIGLALVSANH